MVLLTQPPHFALTGMTWNVSSKLYNTYALGANRAAIKPLEQIEWIELDGK